MERLGDGTAQGSYSRFDHSHSCSRRCIAKRLNDVDWTRRLLCSAGYERVIKTSQGSMGLR